MIVFPVIYFAAAIALFAVYFESPVSFVQIFGMVISIFAFMLWIVARVQLAENFSIGPKANELVTTGLYSKFRHPVYYFSIIAISGVALVVNSMTAWALVVFLVVLEVLRIRSEEKVLCQTFGKRYIDYKNKTWF